MTFIKNCKFPLCLEISVCLFLDNRGLDIMFDDHLGREQALLDFKNNWFYIAAMVDFSLRRHS